MGAGGVRRPHLLAVDHPFVAIEYGAGPQRHEIGPGVGLGEQLAPLLVGTDQGGQVALLLGFGAGREQRSDRQVHPDPERSERRCVIAPQLLFDHLDMGVTQPAAAVLDRNVHTRQAGGGELTLQVASPVDEGLVTVGGPGDDVVALVIGLGVPQPEPRRQEGLHLGTELLHVDVRDLTVRVDVRVAHLANLHTTKIGEDLWSVQTAGVSPSTLNGLVFY